MVDIHSIEEWCGTAEIGEAFDIQSMDETDKFACAATFNA